MRVEISGRLVGELCWHCNAQLLDGRDFCNPGHFHSWYRQQRQNLKRRPWW